MEDYQKTSLLHLNSSLYLYYVYMDYTTGGGSKNPT